MLNKNCGLVLVLLEITLYSCVKVQSQKPEYSFINNGKHFEGDILLDKYTAVVSTGRVSIIHRSFKWDYGIVPYVIDASLGSYAYERQLISQAMATVSKASCVRFTPRTNQKYYVRFIRGKGCYSYVGKSAVQGQAISIGAGCGHLGIVLHELMHSLGFFHTSSRPDRDSYVIVYYNNIKSGHRNDFRKYTSSEVSRQGVPYDLKSILHLPRSSFSKNHRNTIESRAGSNIPLGQLNGLSPIDIQEINTLYKCTGYKGCYHSLGMEDGRIRDSWISASSYQIYYEPRHARLHCRANYKGAGVWCASYLNNGQYLMIDLGKTKRVSGIATQGKIGVFTRSAWVKSYDVRYSQYRYYSWRTMYQSFSGNWDGSSSHYNSFNYPITARYVMVVPTKWRQQICMRVELYGCDI